jgi:hypothetical protein
MRTICLARGEKYSLETLAARSFQTLLRITSACSRLTWPKERLTWEILTPPGIREFTLMRGIIPPRA